MPLEHVPELMCALGHYPTQAAVTDMISALACAAAAAGEARPTDVDLEGFLALFHNFKTAGGVRARPPRCAACPRRLRITTLHAQTAVD